MREQVLQYIRERKLLKAGDRVGVAVSGGADSVALLRVLLELREQLGIVLVVAHYNHQLRGLDSDADESFVAELAGKHDLPFFAGRGDVRHHSEINKRSLELEARVMRYAWLHELARSQRLNAVATAHSNDDQAETVLMKFLRGAGTRGLAGIHPRREMDGWTVIRPLLETARAEIERYLNGLGQTWREDHSNRDRRHLRNRIRHELLPLLEREYNPNLRQVLSESADVARAEQDFWFEIVAQLRAEHHPQPRIFQLAKFEGFPVALQRRLLKEFLEHEGIPPDFHHVEGLRRCALGSTPTANLPNGWQAVHAGERLQLSPPRASGSTSGYEQLLLIPGEQSIPELGIAVRAIVVPAEAAAVLEPPGLLLDRARIGSALTLRNYLPGDRFRPAYSGSEEKLKRLFSEKKIPAEQRPLWPVAVNQDAQVVWVQGFPVAHDFAWTAEAGDAVKLEVLPIKPAADAI